MKTALLEHHFLSLLEKGHRLDERKFDEFRKIEIEYGISSKSAEGSARVKIGNTEVIAGVKMEVGTPYPDTLDEGNLTANVELLPLSSSEFETGPPSIKSIELARYVVDRGIRDSECIDFKKLCIKKGEKVWTVLIDVYSINDDGNLADAIGLAAIAALKDAYFPKYDEKTEKIDYKEKSKKKIDLQLLPIPITVVKIRNVLIVDPSLEEEKAADARLTITTTEEGDIVALQKGGDWPLTGDEIEKMVELSIQKGAEVRKALKWKKKLFIQNMKKLEL